MINAAHDGPWCTLGQEFSGYAAQVASSITRIEMTLPGLMELAQGGTAVGTGLNAHPQFAARTVAELTAYTDWPWICANNRFAALAGHGL